VRAGNWYFAVDCSGCGKPVALFEDQSCGTKPVYFDGEGDIKTVCPHCGADALYTPALLRSWRAA
jgi:DNA-directed RNA polymerase subunit RPC12/RpoP